MTREAPSTPCPCWRSYSHCPSYLDLKLSRGEHQACGPYTRPVLAKWQSPVRFPAALALALGALGQRPICMAVGPLPGLSLQPDRSLPACQASSPWAVSPNHSPSYTSPSA